MRFMTRDTMFFNKEEGKCETMYEIARVPRGKNNMETAKAFARCEAFKNYRISEIIENMRSYEKCGWLIYTDTEAIMYHDCNQ